MRLIDADEFAIEEPKLWDWSSVNGISSAAVLKQCIWDIQCAPTVDAIPITWIEKYIWAADTHEEKRALRKMYMWWEEEKTAAFEKAMCKERGVPYETN